MSLVSTPKLIRTAQAARELGIDPSTLYRWEQARIVTPATRTAGGQARWNLEELREQLREHLAKPRQYEDQVQPTAEREEPFTPAKATEGLVSSGQAAEIIGATKSALSKWARQGLITPTERVGKRGDARWDIDDLKRQLAEKNLSGRKQ